MPDRSVYEKYLPKTLQQSFVAATEDPELMSLKDELALLRTLLGRYIEQAQGESDTVDSQMLKDVGATVDKIVKAQGAISAHETRMREVIPAKMIPMMVRAIGQIIKGVIQDERAVMLIQQKILELPNMPIKMIEVKVDE